METVTAMVAATEVAMEVATMVREVKDAEIARLKQLINNNND